MNNLVFSSLNSFWIDYSTFHIRIQQTWSKLFLIKIAHTGLLGKPQFPPHMYLSPNCLFFSKFMVLWPAAVSAPVFDVIWMPTLLVNKWFKHYTTPDSKDAKTTLIRHRSDTLTSDKYLIDFDLKVFALGEGQAGKYLCFLNRGFACTVT